MKHISLLALAITFSISGLLAQNEMDVYRFSKNDLAGTARSVSMGGAFGALGGDVSAIVINPAGIGVYKNSEIVTTLNFQNIGIETNLTGDKYKENKFNFNFDNLAFVSTFPLDSEEVPLLNFGFSYNRLKNFDREYRMAGKGIGDAMVDYMARRAGDRNPDMLEVNNSTMWDVWDYEDWLSALGYNAGLINPNAGGRYDAAWPGLAVNNDLLVREKGSVSTYDFNVGTTISDIFSIGATLSVTDINYHLYSSYIEDVEAGGLIDGYELENWMKTEGAGWQVKAGVIFKPVNEFRIGVSYHSPTWYQMTDHFAANLGYDYKSTGNKGSVESYDGREDAVLDYQMRTPDKWTFSLAGVIGNKAIISADYELTNYGSMKLFNRDGDALDEGLGNPNDFIKEDFKTSSAVRLGLEYRFTNQFSGRVGYSWVQSPINATVKDNQGPSALGTGDLIEVTTDKHATTHYVLDGDTHYITYGLGYRFSRNFYTDVAFVMKNQKDDLYSHAGAEKSSFKTNSFQGLLTLGYRF